MPPKPHPKSKYATRDESQEQRSKAEKGAIAELPLLRFTENATENNFQIFREALQLYAMVHFKDLGRMIEMEEYYVPPEIEIPPAEDLTPENDPLGFLAHDIRTQVAERRKLMASMQANRSALYSVILGQLSTESKARIKLSEHWLKIDEGKEPLELWLLIIQTHTAGVAGEVRVDYKMFALLIRPYVKVLRKLYLITT